MLRPCAHPAAPPPLGAISRAAAALLDAGGAPITSGGVSHHIWWVSHHIWGKATGAVGQVLRSARRNASPVNYFSQGVIPLHPWSIPSPAQVPKQPAPGRLGCQQALLWWSLPAQGCPPCCGAGLEQCRLRRDVPAWHGDQPDQQLQRPSVPAPGDTHRKKGKTNRKGDFRPG